MSRTTVCYMMSKYPPFLRIRLTSSSSGRPLVLISQYICFHKTSWKHNRQCSKARLPVKAKLSISNSNRESSLHLRNPTSCNILLNVLFPSCLSAKLWHSFSVFDYLRTSLSPNHQSSFSLSLVENETRRRIVCKRNLPALDDALLLSNKYIHRLRCGMTRSHN
jgi:hypothetical protein